MAAKQGAEHHLSVLTERDVISLRTAYARGGTSFTKLTESLYGRADEKTVRSAIRGVTWAHLPGAVKLAKP